MQQEQLVQAITKLVVEQLKQSGTEQECGHDDPDGEEYQGIFPGGLTVAVSGDAKHPF